MKARKGLLQYCKYCMLSAKAGVCLCITMVAFILILLLLALLYARPAFHGNIQTSEPWLSRERTCFVNSFFIFLVFIGHISQYQIPYSPLERTLIRLFIPGQLIVTTFFFYSGYGIMLSLCQKGGPYVHSLISRRFPQLLLNFSIAVLLYGVLQFSTGHSYSTSHILLSLVGWESLGNSTWFICTTLIAYLFIYVSFTICGTRRPYAGVSLVAVLLAACIPLILLEKHSYWVDTYLCIPAGMLFALCKSRVETLLARVPFPSIALGGVITAAGYIMHHYSGSVAWHLGLPDYCMHLPIVIAGSILFAFGLTLTYGCISFRRLPKFMVWAGGAALFPLYIFQRIPMIIGLHFGLNETYPHLYIAACLALSIALAFIFMRLFRYLAARLFPSAKPPQSATSS